MLLPATGIAVCAVAAAVFYTRWGFHYGLDLHVYRDGVRTWEAGRDPYHHLFTRYELPFTYPPSALLFLAPLDLGSFPAAQAAEWIASLLAIAAACAVVVRRSAEAPSGRWRPGSGTGRIGPAPRLLAHAGDARAFGAVECLVWACVAMVIVGPARSVFRFGQVDAFVMLAVLADLLVVPRRHRGWLIGLAAAVKLTPLVFLLLFAMERDWRSVARAVGTVVALSLTMLATWPVLTVRYWSRAAWNVDRIGTPGYVGNQSWYGVLSRVSLGGVPRDAFWAAGVVVVLAACAVIAFAHLQVGERGAAVVAVALGTLLVSPISWTHEWVWVVLVPALALTGLADPVYRRVRAMLWVLLGVAMLAPYSWIRTGSGTELLGALLPLWAVATLAVWVVARPRVAGPGVARPGWARSRPARSRTARSKMARPGVTRVPAPPAAG